MEKDDSKKDNADLEKWVEKSASFLQSHDWVQFQQSLGRKSLQFDFFMEKRSLPDDRMVANFYFYTLPFLKGYWYCPRGPIGSNSALEVFLNDFSNFVKNFSNSKPKPIFVRVEFYHLRSENLVLKIENLGFEKSPHTMQPEKTSIINLSLSDDDLLQAMQSKTRYNIKIAQKNKVEVREINSIDPFLELLHETSSRNKFHLHPDTYYKRLFDFFSDPKKSIKIEILGAFLGNTLLAADMVIFYGNRSTYLHGASSSGHRNLMAPYLLHWEIMQHAKKLGFSEYDLWGIDAQKWPGVTRFKEGFGGKEIEYIGSYDFPIKKLGYKIYKTASKIKRAVRFF